MHPYILHNGEIRDAREKLLSPGQVGFLNGWGVFSTLRVCEGVLFAFERHYRRLQRDAALIHVPFDVPADSLRAQLLSLVQANHAENATLRVAIIRNKGGLFESPGLTQPLDVIAFTADLSNWGTGVHLTYLPNARFGASPLAGTKVTSWAQNLTWYEQAHESGFDEMILLNEDGRISECTSANIFAIKGQDVWTPPLASSGCLPGVTRAILLEELQLPSITIRERELSPSELEDCDQVFITSSTRDLLPALTIDHTRLKQDRATLKLLQSAFAENRKAYIECIFKSRELVTK